MTPNIARVRAYAIQTSDSNVFQMIGIARQPTNLSLNRAARLHEQQCRAFKLTCHLIDHAVRNCDLALQMSRPEWMERCELGARRLYAKIALFWAWNVPIEYRKELQFRSDRLKEAVSRLQGFRESSVSQAGMLQPSIANRSAPSPRELIKAGRVIEFPRHRKPARRTKKIETNHRSSRILTTGVE